MFKYNGGSGIVRAEGQRGPKGIARALKAQRRTEAIARQQKNVDRGYSLIDSRDESKGAKTPALVSQF